MMKKFNFFLFFFVFLQIKCSEKPFFENRKRKGGFIRRDRSLGIRYVALVDHCVFKTVNGQVRVLRRDDSSGFRHAALVGQSNFKTLKGQFKVQGGLPNFRGMKSQPQPLSSKKPLPEMSQKRNMAHCPVRPPAKILIFDSKKDNGKASVRSFPRNFNNGYHEPSFLSDYMKMSVAQYGKGSFFYSAFFK